MSRKKAFDLFEEVISNDKELYFSNNTDYLEFSKKFSIKHHIERETLFLFFNCFISPIISIILLKNAGVFDNGKADIFFPTVPLFFSTIIFFVAVFFFSFYFLDKFLSKRNFKTKNEEERLRYVRKKFIHNFEQLSISIELKNMLKLAISDYEYRKLISIKGFISYAQLRIFINSQNNIDDMIYNDEQNNEHEKRLKKFIVIK